MRRLITTGLCGLAAASLVACSGPAQNQPKPTKPGPATQPNKTSAAKNRPLPPLKGPPTTRPALPPPPKPQPKPKLPTGSLARADIQRVVRRNLKPVQYCYERKLIKNPQLAGRLLLSIVVDVDGSVREATVDHSTLNDPDVESCVVDKVRAWAFPKPRGGIVIIKYPFVFRASTRPKTRPKKP